MFNTTKGPRIIYKDQIKTFFFYLNTYIFLSWFSIWRLLSNLDEIRLVLAVGVVQFPVYTIVNQVLHIWAVRLTGQLLPISLLSPFLGRRTSVVQMLRLGRDNFQCFGSVSIFSQSFVVVHSCMCFVHLITIYWVIGIWETVFCANVRPLSFKLLVRDAPFTTP